MKPSWVLLIAVVVLGGCDGANILYLARFGSPSHHVWNMALTKGLLGIGHHVTMLTHQEVKEPLKNFTLIKIEGLYETLAEKFDMRGIVDASPINTITYLHHYPETTCTHDMQSEELKQLLKYPKDHFDLIIYDATIGQCFYPLIDIFKKPPTIVVSLLPPVFSKSYGTHLYPSYMPFFSTEFTDRMSFTERVLNFIYLHAEWLYFRYVEQPIEFKMAQKRFGNEIRPFDEIDKDISLVFTNLDASLDYPIALPPHVIPLGGLQIKPAGKLPQELQEILDKAKHGVIYFSLGTNIMSDVLGAESTRVFLEAFRRIPQIVLWKFDLENMDNVPENVIIRQWFPQRDILAHPNVKAFISQCGGFSNQESVYHEVPLIGVPFIVDQYNIAKRFDERKLGKFLDHRNLTSDNIYEAITEVLNNPIYAKNMKIASKRFKDHPQKPLDLGLYWVEYLLRHGGAQHLTPAGRYMPLYQLENLDVIFFLSIALISTVIFTYYFLVYQLSFLRPSKS